ncbi:trypsin-like peptidase domain-containing protein, partial [Oleiagrimonas sp.]|uniref:S1 family peptidase n=1 Tax=Oleiagrimonas sp. TaxID=2010330 RepID=UPI00262B40E6
MTYCVACILALVGIGFATNTHAASMDAKLLPNVQASTFEVVAAKPTHDPLHYARKLPMDLLPYQQRTDKYYSIGTAFALGHNRYVTAGHVLMVGLDSLWGPLALRDASGHVYAIDKIEKFSLRKDFVMFSLKNPPRKAAYPVNTDPELNQVVYAVGNALGTGVVIRDGLYTSNTPEQQSGSWKWMRFSAAASPGNSGGPLLDANGRVVGVVLMKSANENLNYALPIRQVLDAPSDLAMIDRRESYGFDVFDTTLHNIFKGSFKLPLSPKAFFAAYGKLQHAYADQQLKKLLAFEPGRMFPRGEGSHKLLHSIPTLSEMPSLVVRDSNGQWGLNGSNTRKISLSDNGYIEINAYKGNVLFHLRKPDSIHTAQLYSDPKQLMDLIARTGNLKRNIGNDQIRITSLGMPSTNLMHTDKWHRHWQIRVWPMAYANTNVLVMTLPVPDGYSGLLMFAPAAQTHDYLINAEALSDFMYVTYSGHLAQWKTFLAQRRLLPDAFRHIHIDFDYGKHFDYASRRINLSWTPKLQKIQPDSVLTLGFSFFEDGDKVVWDVADVWAAPNPYDSDAINVARWVRPSSDM